MSLLFTYTLYEQTGIGLIPNFEHGGVTEGTRMMLTLIHFDAVAGGKTKRGLMCLSTGQVESKANVLYLHRGCFVQTPSVH